MKRHISNRGLRIIRFVLGGLLFLLLASPSIALIGFAYFNNIFFLKNIVDVGVGILGSLYRSNALWILLGIYGVFLVIGFLINMAILFIERKLKKEEACDERID